MMSLLLRPAIRRVANPSLRQRSAKFSSAATHSSLSDDIADQSLTKLFNPTEEHAALREMVRSFAEREVEPQAIEHNRTETFNQSLFRQFGSHGLGILGLTVPEEYGGTGFINATAVAIVHEELSYSDPALCLSYLAHSVLLCNNLAVNGSHEQVRYVWTTFL